jgi:hypothetical protein
LRTAGADTSQVVKRRQRGSSSTFRAFRVLVDGNQVGKLRQGDELPVDVEPGTHAVQIKIDWAGSEPLKVTAGPGEVIGLVCQPAPFAKGLASIFRQPLAYIELRASDQTTEGREGRLPPAKRSRDRRCRTS